MSATASPHFKMEPNGLLKQVEDILQAERDALMADDLSQVESLTTRKAELFAALDGCHSALLPALQQQNAEGRRLRSRLLACQTQNRSNGVLIQAKLRLTTQTLDILRNGEASQTTYDAQGQSHSLSRQHPLGSV